ncbi:MAG TPA: tetratricopeptide repeat protein [Anaerolineae bacterium]|nr:tetratricopeptide repeat protein [Anaerolineae bacterium]
MIELAPHWAEAWLNRAIAQQRRGDLTAASVDLEHYLTMATDPGWRATAGHQLMLIKAVNVEQAARQK